MKFCPECGRKHEGEKFCPECGYKFDSSSPAPAGSAPRAVDTASELDALAGAFTLAAQKAQEERVAKERAEQERREREERERDFLIKDGEILAYFGSKECVEVPDRITKIGEGAFGGKKMIKKVILPEGITHIGGSAFGGCENLESINLPNSLRSIVKGAFMHTALKTVAIPNGVTSLTVAVFAYCSQLTTVFVPDGLQVIESSAFAACGSLTKIVPLTEGRTCSGLKEVTLAAFLQTGVKQIYVPKDCEIHNSCYDPDNFTVTKI